MNIHEKIRQRLRQEVSQNKSGRIFNEGQIPILREKDYLVEDYELDGDAPKQFKRSASSLYLSVTS